MFLMVSPKAGRTTPQESGAIERRCPITIVVPCFNEEPVISALASTLRSAGLDESFDVSLIFVDDASTDGTLWALRREFGAQRDATVIAHDHNSGIAGAISTGIRAAKTEIVCSIDSDCSYDPRELGAMIPLLSEGVDMVTASPYHKLGVVRNIPGWRLFFSRSVSRMYRVILRNKLDTYTSCFRVYRRSSVLATSVHNTGFLGIAEQLARIDLNGGTIVEFPTVLRARELGTSKLRIARTVGLHLGFLARLAGLRLRAAVAAPRSHSLASELPPS
jgi:glycosyltransferase involved in cell wall biosynthesis